MSDIETKTYDAPTIDYENADYYTWIRYLEKLFKWYIDQAKDSDGVFAIGWSWDILRKFISLIDPLAGKREKKEKTVLDFIKSYINERTGEPMFGHYELLEGKKKFAIQNIKEKQRWKYEPDTHR